MTVIEGWRRGPERKSFSPTDAAFTGFSVARREPRTLAVWAVLILLFSLLLGGLMAAVAGPELMAMRGVARPTPEQSLQLMGKMLPLYLVLVPATLAFFAVLSAAVNRAVLHPAERGGLGRLRLGADELRLAGLFVLIGLLLFGVELAGGLVLGLLIVLGALVSKVAAALLAVLGVLLLIAFVIWLVVRLSLAGPLTFESRRVSIRAAFRMTKGRFWPLLGAYLLSTIFSLLIALALLVVLVPLAFVAGGGAQGLGDLFQPDLSSLAAYFTAPRLLTAVLGSVPAALQYAVALGAPAGAYAQLAGEGEPPQTPPA